MDIAAFLADYAAPLILTPCLLGVAAYALWIECRYPTEPPPHDH